VKHFMLMILADLVALAVVGAIVLLLAAGWTLLTGGAP
jgi:hypothetical protein